MLVDLVTPERNLEDLMLGSYPGKIRENQIEKKGEKENKIFYFLGLDYEELTSFLTEGGRYNFWIFEHTTRRFIESNHNFINSKSTSIKYVRKTRRSVKKSN